MSNGKAQKEKAAGKKEQTVGKGAAAPAKKEQQNGAGKGNGETDGEGSRSSELHPVPKELVHDHVVGFCAACYEKSLSHCSECGKKPKTKDRISGEKRSYTPRSEPAKPTRHMLKRGKKSRERLSGKAETGSAGKYPSLQHHIKAVLTSSTRRTSSEVILKKVHRERVDAKRTAASAQQQAHSAVEDSKGPIVGDNAAEQELYHEALEVESPGEKVEVDTKETGQTGENMAVTVSALPAKGHTSGSKEKKK